MTLRKSMLLMTLSSVFLWLLRTFEKCYANTLTFSSSFSASSPEGSFMCMECGEEWWLLSPALKSMMFDHAYFGWNGMLWMVCAIWCDCLVLDIPMASSNLCCSLLSLLRVVAEEVSLVDLIMQSTYFCTSNVGVIVSRM